jgi:A118 family predicted phage portal protein
MPLPDGGNIPWPPKECEPINRQYAIWWAWFSGDMETLSAVYGGGGNSDTHGVFASEAGGWRAKVGHVIDTVRRWFWGRSGSKGNVPRQRVHVPLAAEIASVSADLLFSEPPTVKVPEPDTKPGQPAGKGDTVTQERLAALMDDGMHATLLESAEIAAALGGVFLRIVWDEDKRDQPWITAVHPDAAVPTFVWGELDSVIFWRVISTKDRLVVRHLEMHERGTISHAVYQGDDDTLGQPVPLTDYPETRDIADSLDDAQSIDTGASGLTAVYVPNMRPNRIWRNTPGAASLGRSDYSGIEPLMDAYDMVESSLLRDIDLGKTRLVVPLEYFRSNGAGGGASVDLDQEIYEPVNFVAEEGSATLQIQVVQPKIRVAEHIAALTDLKSTIVGGAGYSPHTFGMDSGGTAVTATEIAAENRRSIITRDRKTRYYRPQLGNLYHTWLEVDLHVFDSGVTPVRPQIEWAAAVSADPVAQATELRELDTAGAISTYQKVLRQHPDWTKEQIDEEVALILTEKAPPPLEDPDDELGPPGGGPPGEHDGE